MKIFSICLPLYLAKQIEAFARRKKKGLEMVDDAMDTNQK